MLSIQNKDRDAIVNFLENMIVPAQTGATIMQIVDLLKKLEEQVIPSPDVPNE
tara:strand:+ start:3275 stop:3433 length:159 start_codon:yes stop_codon:yes gene_type:complete